MRRKIIAAALFLLLAGILSGCGSTETGKTVNKGRYIEEEIELPEGEEVIDLLCNKENQLELYTTTINVEKMEYKKYTLQTDGKWKLQTASWLNKFGKILSKNSYEGIAEKIVLGQDGAYYVLVQAYGESESRNYIFRSPDGKEDCVEVDITYLEEIENAETGYTLHRSISDFNVLSNGTLLLNDSNQSCFLLFSQDGKSLGKLNVGGQNSSMDAGNGAYVVGNEIIGIKSGSPQILDIDGESQKETRSIELNQEETGACVSKLSDGTLLLADKKGIHRLGDGGTLWETVVDGELGTMSMPTMFMENFFAEEGDTEAYYILYRNTQGGNSLIHYIFDENIVSVPKEELTVYSLQENTTVRQAISLFQRKHQDVKVNYVVAMKDGETNSKENIKALNTELIAGNGADILILDGLPVDSYKKQGVLKDINSLCESAGILPNILDAYREDGSVYEIPTKIEIPLITGKKEAVESAQSLAAIVAYEKENSERPFVKDAFFKDAAKELLKMELSSFITENNALNTDTFEKFLEDISYLKENGSFTSNENMNFGFDSNAYSLNMEETNATWEKISYMDSLFVEQALCNKNDYVIGGMENAFYGNGCIGINHATKKEKLAEEFLTCILSDEVQKTYVNDGLPVSEKSWDTLVQNEKKDMYYGISFVMEDGSYATLDGEYPTKETREKFAQIAKTVLRPIKQESNLVDMIITEMEGYFNGSKDNLQTIDSVESKVNTYLTEQMN